ncbi:MAG TPA: GntR family transcriptional regulator [Thermoguttaceae bacterium]
MRVDPSSQVPVFKQIADYLRSCIAAGIYRPDEAMPSKRVLGMKLGVNPHTVQHAYEDLQKEGLVQPRRGAGMFVSEQSIGRAQTNSERACYKLLERAFRIAREANLSEDNIRNLVERAIKPSANKVPKQSETR